MSSQETILQIMPATGWVAVYDEGGEESAEALVCFALVDGGRAVRPMRADGNKIAFADVLPNFVRVEELAEFEEEEEDEDEEEEEDEEA